MEHETRDEGKFTVVALKGDVDMHCTPHVRKIVLACLDKKRPLLVDLTEVTYMDSSGVASLVEGLQRAKKLGLLFALAGVSPAVMSVLRLARLDRVFTMHETLADALA